MEARGAPQAPGGLHQGAGDGRAGDAADHGLARAPRYERFLSFLGTLGSNAPFVGLFGTVLGIIKAFHDLGAVASRRAPRSSRR